MAKEKTYLFLNSVFPSRTETFVYDQFMHLKRMRLPFRILSNNRPKEADIHPHMRAIAGEVDYLCDASLIEVIKAHIYALRSRPLNYYLVLWQLMGSQTGQRTALKHLSAAAVILRRYEEKGKTLHLHANFAYGAAAVAMWAARLEGNVQYSLTLHGSDILIHADNLKAKLAEAKGLTTISHYNANHIRKLLPDLPEGRISVIHLGVEAKKITRKKPALSGGTPCIFTVGRMIAAKGHSYLTQACAILKRREIDFICEIAGDGPLRAQVEQEISALGLEKHITLLGHLPHKEILKRHTEADIFILPSVSEGIPIVLMEAMRAGTPVVASEITGIPELITHGKTGLLVPARDPEAFADAVETLVTSRATAGRLASAAQKKVAEDFDLKRNTKTFKTWLEAL